MTTYIYPKPGVPSAEVTLDISIFGQAGNITVPSLQDVTVQADNDVFTWEQLDEGSKKQIATTATNSLSMNIVLDQLTFFGNSAASANVETKGIFGLSNDKELIEFSLYFGDTSEGTDGSTISGQGYITGLSPTVSASSPVWVSPITITVDGDYSVA